MAVIQEQADPIIYPVVLSGGSGTRLWPLSRALFPKQLLPLAGPATMLQETAGRVGGKGFGPPLVVCNQQHRFLVAEQLRQIGIRPQAILLEPTGRNTAPAAAVAALALVAIDPDAIMLLLPSDHVIRDNRAFLAAVDSAAAAARTGALVTFGVQPDFPETGYGYIRRGAPLPGHSGCHHVAEFVEKPDRAAAENYLAAGDYYWNSGMFVFSAKCYLEELERLEPKMLAGCREALEGAAKDLDFHRLADEPFANAPSKSIDYAVMEQTRSAAVVPVDMGWSDVGSWSALWEIGDRDQDGNVRQGDVITEDVRNSYIRTEGPLVAVIGVENVVVVATQDAVLVVDRDKAQDVKKVVDHLQAKSRSQHVSHVRMFRPWGHYQSIDAGERFQVKRITVRPGAKLSLQMHHHRAEHWVVVSGTAQVTRGDETVLLTENQSTYIPIGVTHRLENPGKVPLDLIEVQSGTYLGEDDIIRFSDTYGRD